MYIHFRNGLFFSFIFTLLLAAPFTASAASSPLSPGTYRCWSFNVGGAGSRCTSPALVLKRDGTYTAGQEHGTYKITKGAVTLSGSKIRGAGKISGGNKITFSYSYKGLRQTVTYLFSQSAPAVIPKKSSDTDSSPQENSSVQAEQKVDTSVAATVEVDMSIDYHKEDSSLSWINTIVLVPQGYTIANALHRPEALAILDGKTKIHAYFRMVETGSFYDVYTSNGFSQEKIGSIDVRKPSGSLLKVAIDGVLSVPLPEKTQESKTTIPQSTSSSSSPSSQPQTASSSASAPLCDPNIPSFSQPGCKQP